MEKMVILQNFWEKLFKKETGKKFSNYLQEVRMKKSRKMLLEIGRAHV